MTQLEQRVSELTQDLSDTKNENALLRTRIGKLELKQRRDKSDLQQELKRLEKRRARTYRARADRFGSPITSDEEGE